ncbi:MAG: tRNA-dihydrouridine synthase family protein, partial [Patescibacteria group bacterium]|nr:tRNA-dihydrouridine synthase family protein [Patescibacteria group bacterium]
MKNFWLKLKKKNKPIYALAPMAGVADSAFRQICKSFGADVVYSEMISATAIVYNSKKTLELMKFDQKERPYVVQLFGSKPEHFAQAAKFITKRIKPDGIDINFGCPVKKVARQGAGAVLMKDFKLARQAIEAVINNTNLPVSIKIRSEGDKATALDFLKSLAGLDIKAVMIHGRSLKQGNSGKVNWRIIRQARKYFEGVILANGGVVDKKTAGELLVATGADGVGIGQGSLGKPWIFSQLATRDPQPATKGLIFRTAMKHARLAEKLKGRQGIIEMRKHLCWYV